MSINFNCKMSEKQLSLNCEKSVKINLRIISKLHSHLQSSVKTSVKFRKNRNKAIGPVAHTRYGHCPFTFIVKMPRNGEVQIAKKVTKII